MNETKLMHKLMIAASNIGARLFRNQVGVAYQGEAVRGPGQVTLGPADVLIRNARMMRAGLCTGSSDCIGWHSVVITPEMVGRRVAIFTAVEVKTQNGRVEPEQRNFVDQVRHAGGIGTICRAEVEPTIDELTTWRGRE